jgi:hypothetical protein
MVDVVAFFRGGAARKRVRYLRPVWWSSLRKAACPAAHSQKVASIVEAEPHFQSAKSWTIGEGKRGRLHGT